MITVLRNHAENQKEGKIEQKAATKQKWRLADPHHGDHVEIIHDGTWYQSCAGKWVGQQSYQLSQENGLPLQNHKSIDQFEKAQRKC